MPETKWLDILKLHEQMTNEQIKKILEDLLSEIRGLRQVVAEIREDAAEII